MLDASYFRALVSCERRGLFASLARSALGVAEPFYRVGVAWRNWQFDAGRRETHRVDVPVISVVITALRVDVPVAAAGVVLLRVEEVVRPGVAADDVQSVLDVD